MGEEDPYYKDKSKVKSRIFGYQKESKETMNLNLKNIEALNYNLLMKADVPLEKLNTIYKIALNEI